MVKRANTTCRAALCRLYASGAGRWLLAALFAAVCMGMTYALYRVTFLNNDDTNIMYALAGYRSGAPFPTHRFINVLLGLFISSLYRVFPAVAWWAAYQILMLTLSLTVINAALLKLSYRNAVPFWTACTVAIVLYLGVFVYTVAWMTFTLTAAMLGTASTALILSLDGERDTALARRIGQAGAIALILLCFATRNSSGYCMLCFVLAAVLYRWITGGALTRRRIRTAVAAGAVLVMLTVTVNSLGVSYYNPVVYRDFESARGHFIDYPHASYEDDPAFFDEMGWDADIYALADNLCFLDPAVNADTMERAAQHTAGETPSLFRRLKDTLAFGVSYFRGSGASEYMLVIVVLLWIYVLLCFGRGPKGKTELTFACLTAAGAALLCFYLCYKGRFPVRTFMLIAVPTAFAEAVYVLRVYGENERRFFRVETWRAMYRVNTFRQRKRVYVICAAAACIVLCWSLVKTQVALFSCDKSQKVAENAAVERYVIEHPENVYITDVTSVENLAAFTVYPDADARPTNLIDWGGTGMHSGWKTAQLAKNGLERLSAEMFLQDNVFFITATDNDKLPLLEAYLKTHAGCTGYTVADTVTGTLNVYRFTFGGEVRP